MKLLLVFIACICGTAALAGVGLVEFTSDGLVVFEGERSVKTTGIHGVTTSLALEAGTWRVGARAFEVASGGILRLGELTGKDGQLMHQTKPSVQSGKLHVTTAEKEKWRLWGEDVWRKGLAEVTLPPGAYRLEWRVNEAVQARLQAVDEDQQASVAVPQMLEVLVEYKTENELLVGPKREGPPQHGDVAVLQDDQSVVVGWQRLQKPVEEIFQSAAPGVPLVTFHSPTRKMAIESIMKRVGIGTPVDSSSALSLALTAADAEDGLGLFSLAIHYNDGVGVSKDSGRAKILIQSAIPKLQAEADRGDAWAQTALGLCFIEGLGLVKSEARGVYLLKEAAKANLIWAEGSLGGFYIAGVGGIKDAAIGVELLRKASDRGNAEAHFNLATCFAAGIGVAKDVRYAALLTRKAAEAGFLTAQTSLGECLLYGKGVEKNIEEGLKWTRMAAERGEAAAQHNLGMCYAEGTGLMSDTTLAVTWFRKAADQGYALAQGALGVSYASGEGVGKDLEKAFFWISKSAVQDVALSQLYLGLMYVEGEAVKRDIHTAISWLRKAAKQGLKQAEDMLQQIDSNKFTN